MVGTSNLGSWDGQWPGNGYHNLRYTNYDAQKK